MAVQDRVESAVREVYDSCPPTLTHYAGAEAREEARRWWGDFLSRLGLPPEEFRGRRVIDVGCGSCEKACFYDDWGARVTGVDVSAEVLRLARDVIGGRAIDLVQASLFDLRRGGEFDIVISDGVLHHTADTRAALEAAVALLRPGGCILFSIVNVWGRFWWFHPARAVTRLLGGGSFRRRARWGARLFRRLRPSQEATASTSSVFRSEESWAHDWFGNPRWNFHSPDQVRDWLTVLGLEHRGSEPPLHAKAAPTTAAARILRRAAGPGARGMGLYWLANRAPNMMYVCAEKPRATPQS